VSCKSGFNRIEPLSVVDGDSGQIQFVRFHFVDRVERGLKDEAGLRAKDDGRPVVTADAHRRYGDVGLRSNTVNLGKRFYSFVSILNESAKYFWQQKQLNGWVKNHEKKNNATFINSYLSPVYVYCLPIEGVDKLISTIMDSNKHYLLTKEIRKFFFIVILPKKPVFRKT